MELSDTEDRRQNPRVPVNWPVNIITGEGRCEGQTKDISVDGLSVICDDPLRLHDELTVSVMPPDHDVIEAKGQVVWSDFYAMEEDATVGIGVCFVEISEQDQLFFERVISEFIDPSEKS